MPVETDALARDIGQRLEAMREIRPLVQNITNFVSMDIAANVLLAAGASPAMVHAPEETGEFLRLADSLVINIGTLSAQWVESMDTAATAARMHGRPWVLDPVGAGATRFRDTTVQRLLRHRPSVIRGNASEIIAVARKAGLTDEASTTRGVDSTNSSDEAAQCAILLARHCLCTVAATGEIDLVTDGRRTVRLGNGSPLMARVTALGCALSATIGAFVGVTPAQAYEATVAAIGYYGVAGEIAGERANRPGSYRTAFLDSLDETGTADIAARLKVL